MDLDNPAVNERHQWNYELCDDDLMSTGLDKYYSSTSHLLMALHTDKLESNHIGFHAVYRFIDKRKHICLLSVLQLSRGFGWPTGLNDS